MSARCDAVDGRTARLTADAEALIDRTRVARGLPRTIEDPVALRKVAVLVAAGSREAVAR